MGVKSVETLSRKIRFSRVLDTFSSLPPESMLILYFLDCTDHSTYATLNWGAGGIRDLNTKRSYKRQGHAPLKHFVGFLSNVEIQNIKGKYKKWTPGPWTPSVDWVHGPGPSKYGPGPWTPFMDRVHGPPIFTTPKITEVNKNKIKSKVNYK